jgi:MFS family permease
MANSWQSIGRAPACACRIKSPEVTLHPIREHKRVLLAALLGTAVEFYDFFIYGTAAALVFGPLFFPSESPEAQTLLAFMSFGIAFFARPVGAVVFGHFGDRVGRKATLVASLLLMGGSTLAIAFLPTYAQAGWIAPALLCLMRFGQGFGLGGEWGGAALLVVEHAPKGWETRFASIMQLGSPIGFFAATAIFMALSLSMDDAAFMTWGWRIPFLASAVLVVIGLWMRLRIEETPAFRASLADQLPERVPLFRLIGTHWPTVLSGSAGVVVTFALFYLSTAFALAEATGVLGYRREDFLAAQLGASLFYAAGILIAGILADRTSPRRVLAVGATATIILGLLFQPGLHAGSLPIATLTLSVAMFVLGLCNGPLGSWLASLFPVRVRYSGVSLAFNLGGIVGGALVPITAQMLSAKGLGGYIGLLLCSAGLLTVIAAWTARSLRSE